MSAYAYISIVDVLLKLGIVFLLEMSWHDRLKIYAILTALVSFFTSFCYYLYTRKKFEIARYHFFWDSKLFNILLGYTGWSLFGNLAAVMSNQGINILLNIYFGSTVNAARAISFQVSSALAGFVNSLQMSINPQIIKSYATNDHKYMQQLVFMGARFSFFLLYFFSLPVILQTEYILKIWLNIVPEYAVIFCRLILVDALIASLSGSLMASVQATGRIKKYQIIVGGILLLNLPISYLLLLNKHAPQAVFILAIILSLFALLSRIFLLRNIINLSIEDFIFNVLFKVSMVVVISIIPFLIFDISYKDSLICFFITTTMAFLLVLISVYFIGLTHLERDFLINKSTSFFCKKWKNYG